MAQAEEILFEGPDKEGFVKDLFFGKFREESHDAVSGVARCRQGTW